MDDVPIELSLTSFEEVKLVRTPVRRYVRLGRLGDRSSGAREINILLATGIPSWPCLQQSAMFVVWDTAIVRGSGVRRLR
jgi:hypothetical protein